MGMQSPEKPPYIDWRLDLWKIGAIIILFLILAAMALWQRTPASDESAMETPTALLEGVVPDDSDIITDLSGSATSVASSTRSEPPGEDADDSTGGTPDSTPAAVENMPTRAATLAAPAVATVATTGEPPPGPEDTEPEPAAPLEADSSSAPEGEPTSTLESSPAVTSSVASAQTATPSVSAPSTSPAITPSPISPSPVPDLPTATPPTTVSPIATLPADAGPHADVTPPTDDTVPPVNVEDAVADGQSVDDFPGASDDTAASELPLEADGVLPLTLANIPPNSVMPLMSVARLEGTGTPGTQVEVHVQYINLSGVPGLLPVPAAEIVVGTTEVDGQGRWQLVPEPALRVGQNVLTLRQLTAEGAVTATSSPVVVNVLGGGEQGPLSLVTPAIRLPRVGERLSRDDIRFAGSGLPGLQLRLYLNNRLVGETLVTAAEEWSLAPSQPLAPGAYVARVAALNAQGEIMAESAPVAFWVLDSPVSQGTSPPAQPLIPLRVHRVIPPRAAGGAMMLGGTATPHSSVAVLLDGIPRVFANVTVEGEWSLPVGFLDLDTPPDALTVVTSLDEEAHVTVPAGETGGDILAPPVIVMPISGVPATTNPPLLTGLARPGVQVRLLLEDVTLAQLTVDALGQWAFVPDFALPSGTYVVTAATVETGAVSELAPAATSRVSLEIPGREE